MVYDTRTITLKVILPDGYYDEFGNVTEEGLATLVDMNEDAGFSIESIEQ